MGPARGHILKRGCLCHRMADLTTKHPTQATKTTTAAGSGTLTGKTRTMPEECLAESLW